MPHMSDCQIYLYDAKQGMREFYANHILLGKENISDLQILCSISWLDLKYLLDKLWLNMKFDIQSYEFIERFSEDSSIDIIISLHPSLIAQLKKEIDLHCQETAISYIQSLAQSALDKQGEYHPFLEQQNWYCTTISQTQPKGEEIIHHTLWHYLLPTLQTPTPDNIADSITHYITDQTAASLNQITQTTDPLFKDIAETFQDLFNNTLTDLDNSLDTDLASEDAPETSESPRLLTPLTDFLEAENWPYALLSDASAENTTLRLSFRGESGQWPCYAKVNQPQQTLCFYSISPIPAEFTQYPAIAEYLTRANYGTVLGNFELDYTDGEIRYKTSIDIEGDTLTPALVQNLIYTNVMMMDQYLPGLLAVLEQNITPEQAIHLVEQNDAISA